MEKIYHIPHSSTHIPEEYIDEFNISKEQLESDALTICDVGTDELGLDGIVFPYSRLFCDVERFNSDKEVMNDVGMGVLYTVNHKLETIRENPNTDILKYYEEHHKKLNDITKEKLLVNDEVLFLDIHSYSNTALPYELHKDEKRPDICIGVNKRYNKDIVEKLIYIIKKYDYTYSINSPFKGCLLPSDYIDDERVHGVMIEINKDIIFDENIKELFECVKEIVNQK